MKPPTRVQVDNGKQDLLKLICQWRQFPYCCDLTLCVAISMCSILCSLLHSQRALSKTDDTRSLHFVHCILAPFQDTGVWFVVFLNVANPVTNHPPLEFLVEKNRHVNWHLDGWFLEFLLISKGIPSFCWVDDLANLPTGKSKKIHRKKNHWIRFTLWLQRFRHDPGSVTADMGWTLGLPSWELFGFSMCLSYFSYGHLLVITGYK